MSNCADSIIPSAENALLELEDVWVSYNGLPALEAVTFSVPPGGLLAVVGPNGAGKSTLFKALAGLLPISAGQIHIHKLPLRHHRHCVAYVPQREEVDWQFPVTARDVVMMGRYGHMGWFHRPSLADRQAVHEAMAQMGILDLADRPLRELSGGQQQRVFLARALAQQPHILLMDEPFTAVDAPTQETTLAVLKNLHHEGITILVSTHDLNLAWQNFDHILLLNRRVIAYGPPQEVLSPANIRHAYASHAMFMENGWVVVDDCCSSAPSTLKR